MKPYDSNNSYHTIVLVLGHIFCHYAKLLL